MDTVRSRSLADDAPIDKPWTPGWGKLLTMNS